MKKKLFTLVELSIYMGLSGVIGVFLFVFATSFFQGLKRSQHLYDFTSSYNNFVTKMYQLPSDGRKFDSNTVSGVVLSNSGEVSVLSGYRGISCLESGIAFTRVEQSPTLIDWSANSVFYSGFLCNSISGVDTMQGTRLYLDFKVLTKPVNVSYLLR